MFTWLCNILLEIIFSTSYLFKIFIFDLVSGNYVQPLEKNRKHDMEEKYYKLLLEY